MRCVNRSSTRFPIRIDSRPGILSGEAGRAAYDTIVRAVKDAQERRVDAIATAPVNKEAFRWPVFPWHGHTDLLAHLTGAPHVAMMFESAGAAGRARDHSHSAGGGAAAR